MTKIVNVYPRSDSKLKIVQSDGDKAVRRTVLALAVVEDDKGEQSIEMVVGADGQLWLAPQVHFPPSDSALIPVLQYDGEDVTEWLEEGE